MEMSFLLSATTIFLFVSSAISWGLLRPNPYNYLRAVSNELPDVNTVEDIRLLFLGSITIA